VIREHVTIHRSNDPGEPTQVGNHCLLMAHCHVGHNCTVGDHVIIANGALLAGHAAVQERVFISGNCLVHQFVRVGTLALMQGGSAISKDLPPYSVARGDNGMCGLNTVGLRRAGFPADERAELKRAYLLLFRSRRKLKDALAAARDEFSSPKVQLLLDFLESGKRGFCSDVSRKQRAGEQDETGS
jgi:UDP-N-acetylglucosamine acyltransferase